MILWSGAGAMTFTWWRGRARWSLRVNAGTVDGVAMLNYTLGANLENLTLTGAASSGTGNTLNNILTGSGNNVLWPGR